MLIGLLLQILCTDLGSVSFVHNEPIQSADCSFKEAEPQWLNDLYVSGKLAGSHTNQNVMMVLVHIIVSEKKKNLPPLESFS